MAISLNSTTLAKALSASARKVYLTSFTNVVAGDLLFVDREAMKVQRVGTTTCDVIRGWAGTVETEHALAATVYTGASERFYSTAPSGYNADTPYTPWIDLSTGALYTVQSNQWVQAGGNPVDLTNNTTGTISLTSKVTGTLPVANGGTGATTLVGAKLPIGAYAAYAKTTNGVQTLLAAASGARNVLIAVKVSQAFSDGDGGQPTFKIGETDTDDKWAATSVFTGAAVTAHHIFMGSLTSAKALIVTAAQATGTTSTGAIQVSVLVMPSA